MEMQFERAFAAEGGRLMAGVDPTGWGGVVAGFGDQRELELLVRAGFSPEEAIRIATRNGAGFLRRDDIGTIARGQRGDLVVVQGNPSVRISDIRRVEIVFKDGIGYDPDALVSAVGGTVGAYDVARLLRWPCNLSIIAILLLVGRLVWRLAGIGRRRARPAR
jgi:Amidohydrolase family